MANLERKRAYDIPSGNNVVAPYKKASFSKQAEAEKDEAVYQKLIQEGLSKGYQPTVGDIAYTLSQQGIQNGFTDAYADEINKRAEQARLAEEQARRQAQAQYQQTPQTQRVTQQTVSSQKPVAPASAYTPVNIADTEDKLPKAKESQAERIRTAQLGSTSASGTAKTVNNALNELTKQRTMAQTQLARATTPAEQAQLGQKITALNKEIENAQRSYAKSGTVTDAVANASTGFSINTSSRESAVASRASAIAEAKTQQDRVNALSAKINALTAEISKGNTQNTAEYTKTYNEYTLAVGAMHNAESAVYASETAVQNMDAQARQYSDAVGNKYLGKIADAKARAEAEIQNTYDVNPNTPAMQELRQLEEDFDIWCRAKRAYDSATVFQSIPAEEQAKWMDYLAQLDKEITNSNWKTDNLYLANQSTKNLVSLGAVEQELKATYGDGYDTMLAAAQTVFNAQKRAKQQNTLTELMKGQSKARNIANTAFLSAVSVVSNAIASPLALFEIVAQPIANKNKFSSYDVNARGFAAQNLTEDIRGIASQDMGKVGSMLYNTVLSGIDSATAMLIGGKAGGALLGINAGTSTATDIVQRGGSYEDAIFGGIVAGVFESLFERVSIGNFYKLKESVIVKDMKDALLNIGKSALVNFTEEAATETANILFDSLAMGDISNWQTKINELTAKGFDERTARNKVIEEFVVQIAEAGLSGAIMGVGFGAVGAFSAHRNINANKFATYYESSMLLDEDTQRALNASFTLDENSTAEEIDAYGKAVLDALQKRAEGIRDGSIASESRESKEVKYAIKTLSSAIVASEAEAQAQADADSQSASAEDSAAKIAETASQTKETYGLSEQRRTEIDSYARQAIAEAENTSDDENIRRNLIENTVNELSKQTTAESRYMADRLNDYLNGGNENGRTGVLSEGQVGNDGASTAVETERVAGGAENRTDSGTGSTVQSISRENVYKTLRQSGQQAVSSASLGITNGTAQTNLYNISKGDSAYTALELGKIDTELAKAGIKNVRFVAGRLQAKGRDGQIHSAGAAVLADGTIIISVTDKQFEPRKLGRHELFHAMFHGQADVIDRIVKRVEKRFTAKQITDIFAEYNRVYAPIYGNDESKIFEEFLADAYAGMNRFGLTDAELKTAWAETRQGVAEEKSKSMANNDSQFSASEDEDAEYMELAKDPKENEHRLSKIIRDIAVKWGAASIKNLRGVEVPIDLYHGTPRFGFTVYEDSSHDVPFIYTSTKSQVSAHYAGDNNYAFVRNIGKKYRGGNSVSDIISDAETVYNAKYKIMSDAKKSEIFADIHAEAEKIADYLNANSPRNMSIYDTLSEDDGNELANHIARVEDIIWTMSDGEYPSYEDVVNDEYGYFKESLLSDIELFERSRNFVKGFYDKHRSEMTKDEKAFFSYLTGYDLGDVAIDISYKIGKILTEDTLLINESDNISTPESLRKNLDISHNIGSYHLYGNLGNKPFIFDANGAQFWALKVPEISDEYVSTDDVCKWALEHGYTSVVMKNIYDYGDLADNYVFVNPSQIKSADLVTYNDEGNIIPPSERFRTDRVDEETWKNEDMRFSSDEEDGTPPVSEAERRQQERIEEYIRENGLSQEAVEEAQAIARGNITFADATNEQVDELSFSQLVSMFMTAKNMGFETILKEHGLADKLKGDLPDATAFTSRVVNTFKKMFGEKVFNAELSGIDFSYMRKSEKQSLREAMEMLKTADINELEKRLYDEDRAWGSTELDAAMVLEGVYMHEAEATGNHAKLDEWSALIRRKATQGGQLIEAFKKWVNSPRKLLLKASEMIEEIRKQQGATKDLQETLTDARNVDADEKKADTKKRDIRRSKREVDTAVSDKEGQQTEIENLQKQIAETGIDNGKLKQNLAKLEPLKNRLAKAKAKYDSLFAEWEKAETDYTSLRAEYDELRGENALIKAETNSTKAKSEALLKRIVELEGKRDSLLAEWEKAEADYNALVKERDSLIEFNNEIIEKTKAANKDIDRVNKQLASLFEKHTNAIAKYYDAVKTLEEATARYNAHLSAYKALQRNIANTKQKIKRRVAKTEQTDINFYDDIVSMLEDRVNNADELGKSITQNTMRMVEALEALDGITDETELRNKLVDIIVENANIRKNKIKNWYIGFMRSDTYLPVDYLRKMAMKQIALIPLDYMKRSGWQKLSTYQTMAQLMSIPTALRNIVSNQVFDVVESFANNIAWTFDELIGKLTGINTVGVDYSWLSKEKRQGAVQGLQRRAIEIGLDVDVNGQKSAYGTGDVRTWSEAANKGKAGAVMAFGEKMMAYELNATDEFLKESVRREAMRGLQPYIDSGKLTIEEATEIAEQEALYRSFQDGNALSKMLSGIKSSLNEEGFGGMDGSYRFGLGDFVQKYTQVTGALIERSIEFSPIGYGKVLSNLIKLKKQSARYYDSTGKEVWLEGREKAVTAQRNISLALGRATTGTGLIALFSALAKLGILKNKDDEENADIDALNAAEGLRGMQINVTALNRVIGGKSGEWQKGDVLTDVAFLEPLNALMAIGTAISNGEGKGILSQSFVSVFDAMLELPTMQTLKNTFDNIQYYNSDEAILGKVGNWAIEFAGNSITGFIPAFVRQFAQATDTTYRNQYLRKTTLGQMYDKVLNAIPFARKTLPAKLTPLGEDKTYGDRVWLNVVNALVSPGGVYVYQRGEVSEEYNRLREAFKDNPDINGESIYPDRNPPKAISGEDADGNKATVELTAEQREQYQRDRGTLISAMVLNLMDSEEYKNASDEQRVYMLSKVKSIANDVAERGMLESLDMIDEDGAHEDYYYLIGNNVNPSVILDMQYNNKLISVRKANGEFKDANGDTINNAQAMATLDVISRYKIPDAQKAALVTAYASETKGADITDILNNTTLTFNDCALIWRKYVELDNNKELSGADKANELAYFVDSMGIPSDARDIVLDKDHFAFSTGFKVQADGYYKYNNLLDDPQKSKYIVDTVNSLVPEEGKTSVTQKQIINAVHKGLSDREYVKATVATLGKSDSSMKDIALSSALSDKDKANAIYAISGTADDNDYAYNAVKAVEDGKAQIEIYALVGSSKDYDKNVRKFTAALDGGVKVSDYLGIKADCLSNYDDGNESIKQAELIECLNHHPEYTDEQKSVLFQLFGAKWKKNPYSKTAMRKFLDAYNVDEEETEE